MNEPLTSEDEELLNAARGAKTSAYAPYSKFSVGAAVRLSDGAIVTGANIENASYGLTICAERVALFTALHQSGGDPSKLVSLALSCGDVVGLPKSSLTPCGACRQVMSELMPADAVIVIDGVGRTRLSALLPMPFSV